MKHTVLPLLLLIGLTSAALAAVPSQLTIQGRLSNSGNALNGSHPAVFRLYDAQTGGNLIWSEGQVLQLEDGLFSAVLGQTSPLPVSLFSGQTIWLESEVDEAVLSPRRPLVSVAYSFRTQRADTANVALSGTSGNEVWSTDGTNAWRPTGRVGIGLTDPRSVLDIQSTTGDHTVNAIHYSATNPKIKLDALAGGNQQSEIQFLKNGTAHWSLLNDFNGDDGQTFGIKDVTNNAVRLASLPTATVASERTHPIKHFA